MFVGNILHFNTNCDCCCDWDKQNVLKLVKIGQDKSSVQTYLQRFISCELYPHFLSLSQCFWESEWWLWIWVSNDMICFVSNLKRWGKTVNSNKKSFTIKSFKIHSEYCGTMKLAKFEIEFIWLLESFWNFIYILQANRYIQYPSQTCSE